MYIKKKSLNPNKYCFVGDFYFISFKLHMISYSLCIYKSDHTRI